MFDKVTKNKNTAFAAEAIVLVGASCGLCALFQENAQAMYYSGMATTCGAVVGAATTFFESGQDAVRKMARNTIIGAAIGFGFTQAIINTHPHKEAVFQEPQSSLTLKP